MDKFAFIIHPLKIDDFTRKFKWMKKIPDDLLSGLTKHLPPFKVSHITGITSRLGKEIEGYFVACPLTSEQILKLPKNYVLNKIIKAGKKAEELGASIVGLGSFTSVIGDKGITVAENLDIPVTTGNSYTVTTAIEGTRLAARKMDVPLEEVTIIGATGSIGRAVSLMLARDVKSLRLVSRRMNKLRDLRQEIISRFSEINLEITTDVENAVRQANIIISASGAVKTLIQPENLIPGAIVCDVARPRDVASKVARVRDDVLVIEGGVVRIPGDVNFNFDFGYPENTAYACMAETMMLTLESRFENYSLGPRIELEKVKETKRLAQKHGFELAGLRSFDKPLSQEKIEEIKDKIDYQAYALS